MTLPKLSRLNVLDLVPFGNAGTSTGFYALRLTPPAWDGWHPGQFVMLRHTDRLSSLVWGRPFSICSSSSRDLVIFFQARGRATSAMAALQPGDELDVWGPLGNALAVDKNLPTLLLAGGIGIAPFVGYVLGHPRPLNLSVEFGHRMPLECYPFDSITEKCNATAHLEKSDEDREAFLALVENRVKAFASGLILACGPTPFLLAVQNFSKKYGARTQLCLETRMACGVGACLGCVVKANLPPQPDAPTAEAAMQPALAGLSHLPGGEGRFVQTCTQGPVFWADSVSLQAADC